MSLMRAVGHDFETNSIWHKGNNILYMLFLFTISAYFIICSLILDKSKKSVLKDQIGINKEHGIFPSDFFQSMVVVVILIWEYFVYSQRFLFYL